jgi:hypothetical protein
MIAIAVKALGLEEAVKLIRPALKTTIASPWCGTYEFSAATAGQDDVPARIEPSKTAGSSAQRAGFIVFSLGNWSL